MDGIGNLAKSAQLKALFKLLSLQTRQPEVPTGRPTIRDSRRRERQDKGERSASSFGYGKPRRFICGSMAAPPRQTLAAFRRDHENVSLGEDATVPLRTSIYCLVVFLSAFLNATTGADIYRWDTQDIIPGTEGIEPGPGVQLDHRNLEYANLRDVDLTGANFERSNLSRAWPIAATLKDANLTGAVVTGTDFSFTTLHGFTKEQLYSTASYQEKDLREIGLGSSDLSDWNLSGQNLTRATIDYSTLTNANLAVANLTRADLRGSILTSANLVGANLTNASFDRSTLTNANLTGANLRGASFIDAIDFASVILGSAAVYNQWTLFPEGFDVADAGLSRILAPVGDFDGNDSLDVSDIDALADWIRGLPHRDPELLRFNAMFDVNSDSMIDEQDHRIWVNDLMRTWIGDADLNGSFDTTDLINVIAAGEYEDSIPSNSTWATGDWNGDGDFDTADIIYALSNGGYEQPVRRNGTAVPEPSTALWLVLGLATLVQRGLGRRRARHGIR